MRAKSTIIPKSHITFSLSPSHRNSTSHSRPGYVLVTFLQEIRVPVSSCYRESHLPELVPFPRISPSSHFSQSVIVTVSHRSHSQSVSFSQSAVVLAQSHFSQYVLALIVSPNPPNQSWFSQSVLVLTSVLFHTHHKSQPTKPSQPFPVKPDLLSQSQALPINRILRRRAALCASRDAHRSHLPPAHLSPTPRKTLHMGRKFDKKAAKTYSVVHRAHDDALYFDNDAPQHVLVEVPDRPKHGQKGPARTPGKTPPAPPLAALDARVRERGARTAAPQNPRANEGLAALYGVLYDDSSYDYMQHLRPLGQAPDSVFIAAGAAGGPAKPRRTIDDLVRDALPSQTTRAVAHDELESIPRELQGLNPDMDPRVREVLEALEDDAYVEHGPGAGDDVFADLLQSGPADEGLDAGDYDEWDMDNYQDAGYSDAGDSDGSAGFGDPALAPAPVVLDIPYGAGEAPADAGLAGVVDNAWERAFQRFQKAQKDRPNAWDSDDDFDDDDDAAGEAPDTLGELPALGGPKKARGKLRRKKGAMTDTSAFSMSSSALFRSEGLTLLDDRFEQLAKTFEHAEDDAPRAEFSMAEERGDLEDMLDDFLDNYELGSGGRKLVKKDPRIDAMKAAAASVSRGKAAQGRQKDARPAAPAPDSAALDAAFGHMALE
ncbi:LTV-domain-containing protein [Metschnikowia bicuspidata var. bicuspidata NRRL YB-4993]|uniref:LTV-domain-containing protein n=1 Tax=Metschnikowia bicuspidata var. bicuspidata NRRL YB-4993 TaxID=869754 RepID=A0A1A0HGE9_9ASCO|nr:LTV-domain-containing protein [Metschnikowia bicuspidata var. bicuspidata NRRL YB-4993]OBA23081.1 LTV-domain-containing protein [Metschnikowia bicuspidata var. bicuspidata NRRL YB-4993]